MNQSFFVANTMYNFFMTNQIVGITYCGIAYITNMTNAFVMGGHVLLKHCSLLERFPTQLTFVDKHSSALFFHMYMEKC